MSRKLAKSRNYAAKGRSAAKILGGTSKHTIGIVQQRPVPTGGHLWLRESTMGCCYGGAVHIRELAVCNISLVGILSQLGHASCRPSLGNRAISFIFILLGNKNPPESRIDLVPAAILHPPRQDGARDSRSIAGSFSDLLVQ
ncbi:BgTH12-06100 [Blumeria graminis f. sp. triticale]|uniref:Bgt-20331 n=3 Tax=Blumeria graminis TaxID=34373 RepID=A0A9X9MKP4_BLUGR|nr:BgTH12-06100 [Blumeria graminis f. sp. triticale]VDB91184.1 Bgt-20331 [Blumeria graminis f. sp. tritici]